MHQGCGHVADCGGYGKPQYLFDRDRRCAVGELFPIGICLSAPVEANGQHHSVGTRSIEVHAIIMPERRTWHNDIGIHPARVELSIAGLDAQQDKRNWIRGVIDCLVGEVCLLTHSECGFVTGNHQPRDSMRANHVPARRGLGRRRLSRLGQTRLRRRHLSRCWLLRCAGWRCYGRWFGCVGWQHRGASWR
jgi:hypothetical protein